MHNRDPLFSALVQLFSSRLFSISRYPSGEERYSLGESMTHRNHSCSSTRSVVSRGAPLVTGPRAPLLSNDDQRFSTTPFDPISDTPSRRCEILSDPILPPRPGSSMMHALHAPGHHLLLFSTVLYRGTSIVRKTVEGVVRFRKRIGRKLGMKASR